MKYRVKHQTTYGDNQPVSVGHYEAWLTPRSTITQTVLKHWIDIDPAPSSFSKLTDYFGNTVTQFLFNQGYLKLTITAHDEVEVTEAPEDSTPSPAWETVLEELRTHQTPETLAAYEFTFASPRCRLSEDFASYGKESFVPGASIRAVMADLQDRFHHDFQFDPAATTVSTPVEQVFRQRRGVCQDFAHLMISILRSLGFATRYVSGYLRTIPPPGKPRLVGADASHAWLSVYAGNGRWMDLDPTGNQFPTTDHITLAWGRDYTDVAPVKGVYIGGSSPLSQVSVDVCPVEESDVEKSG